MEPIHKFVYTMFILVLVAFAGHLIFFDLVGTHTSYSSRASGYRDRERELLATIEEYKRREQTRVDRENELVAGARERAERFETAIGALGGLDRRSGELLQELVKEINFLADSFRSISNEFSHDSDNMGSE